jgi:hypothetical protein
MRMDTGSEYVEVKSIDGFTVVIIHDETSKSGRIIVFLIKPGGASTGAALSRTCRNVSSAETLALPRKFNWKSIEEKARAAQ